ncbi:MAG: flagellar protein FlaG [Spirochaetota bacterium]
MDISLLLSQTIHSLSQPQANSMHHAGEISLADAPRRQEGGKDASPDEIDQVVRTLNGAASSVDTRVSFEYNEKTKRLVMRMKDPETNEVVKEFPSKEALRILENIHDMLGVFIDEQR